MAPNPFVNGEEGKEAILNVGDPKSETNWAVFGYTPDNKKEVTFLKKGNGYLDAFRGMLTDTNLAYILYGVLESSDGDYSTVKYMLVAWVGQKVKPLHRARSAHHRVAIYQYASELIPMHGELQVRDPSLVDSLSNYLRSSLMTGIHL